MVQPVYCPKCGAMPMRGGYMRHRQNDCTGMWQALPHIPQPSPVTRSAPFGLEVIVVAVLLALLFAWTFVR